MTTALRDAAARLGPWGLAGLACALLALALAAGIGRTLLQQRAALLQAAPPELPLPAARADDSAAAQLARFQAAFPPAGGSAQALRKLQSAARRAGLQLDSGEYRLERRGTERLLRYAVVLPVQGSYAQLRQFIDTVLAELPYAALEDVELRRDGATAAQLQARVRLTLFLRSER